mgnify:CR=1 FL=1
MRRGGGVVGQAVLIDWRPEAHVLQGALAGSEAQAAEARHKLGALEEITVRWEASNARGRTEGGLVDLC